MENNEADSSKVKSRIPEFSSYAEEAQFWDTHDFADYWDETAPVDLKFSRNLSENLTVRLSPEAIAVLRSEAGKLGIGPSTLARMWIVKELREIARSSTPQA